MLCSISLLAVIVAHLHIWAEKATTILMPTEISVSMSKSVNPILLRPVLGTCPSHKFSTAQDGAVYVVAAVWSSCTFPLVRVKSICRTSQELQQTQIWNSVVLIISCLSLLFGNSRRPGRFHPFYKQGGRGWGTGFCLILLWVKRFLNV